LAPFLLRPVANDFFASERVNNVAEFGMDAVFTHPLDDGVRAFHARFGFADLPFDPQRNMFAG
jgi:hypothetical protein